MADTKTKGSGLGPHRTVPMEVLSLGMSRTGTASLAAAFNILGVPAYHGFRFISNPEEGIHWERAALAKFYKGRPYPRGASRNLGEAPYNREQWDRLLLGNFGAVCDVGGYMFWQELIDLYPEAKVVLVERDIEKWYNSFAGTILPGLNNWIVDFICYFVEPALGEASKTANAARRLYEGYFGCYGKLGRPCSGSDEVERELKGVYRWHYDTVRKTLPEKRLLNYELGSGWGPLCAFLGKPIPDVPFPHVNEQAELAKRQWEATKDVLWRGVAALAKYVLLPIAVLAIAVIAAWRR